jgi:hypothetical protein
LSRRRYRRFFRRNHRQRDPGFGAGAGDKPIRVVGLARRLGGDGADMADAMMCNALGANFQCRNGAVDGLVRQAAGLAHALAQADNPGKRIHHLEMIGRGGPGNQKPAIVGAQIQHRQERAAGLRRICLFCPRMRPVFLQFRLGSRRFSACGR